MQAYRLAAILLASGIWVQFITASMVVYFDPLNNTFPYTQLVFSWPGVLEEIHRIWALVISLILVYALTVFVRNSKSLGSRTVLLSFIVAILFVLQATFGALTIWSYDYPPYVILHEGNAGVLLFSASFLAAICLST
ncbi:MAG: COX15/CtaA family protein [Thermoprotei archaeon]